MSALDTVTPNRLRAGPHALRAGCTAPPRGVPRPDSLRLFRPMPAAIAAAADGLICAAGSLAAYGLAWSLPAHGTGIFPLREAVAVSSSLALLIVMLLHRDGAYRGSGGLLHIRDTERALRLPAQAVLAMLPLSLLLTSPGFDGSLLLALMLIPGALVARKRVAAAAQRAWLARRPGLSRVVAYGIAGAGRRILAALADAPQLGMIPVGVIDDGCRPEGSRITTPGYRGRRSIAVMRGPVTPARLEAFQCDLLLVALPALSPRQVAAAVAAAHAAGVQVLLLSAIELQEQRWTESFDLDGFALAPLLTPREHWPYRHIKRMFDLAAATLVFMMLAPVFVVLAFLIRLDSPGPALFAQDRIGREGERFILYKFRTMYKDTPRYAPSPVTARDPRITRIGRFLRRSGLDEMPQLFNVLRGDMSLVGPRPEMPFLVRRYSPEQRQRLQVPPGITGLWQLSADRAYPIHENIQYDLYYIRHRGFFLDVGILLHTALLAMGRGI